MGDLTPAFASDPCFWKISEETPFYGTDELGAKFVREDDAGWLWASQFIFEICHFYHIYDLPWSDPVIQSLFVRCNIPDHTLKAIFLTTKMAF